jgi:hypothetical protein
LPLREVVERMARLVGVDVLRVDVSQAELEAAGLDRSCSPWSGRWVSVLDPSLAVTEWGFEARRLDEVLPAVVKDHLDRRPSRSHPGYASRARERELAARLAAAR